MLDHIIWGADFTTTCLTTFRTGLPGDSSTRRTLYQFFRTKKHVLDAISRKKLYPFAWGGRGRKFKSCHSDQISTVIMIRKRIVKAVLVFCFKALVYKAFSCFEGLVEFQHNSNRLFLRLPKTAFSPLPQGAISILKLNKR